MENKVGNHIFQTHARLPEKLQFHSKSGEAKDQAHIKHLDIAGHVSKLGTYSSYFFLGVCVWKSILALPSLWFYHPGMGSAVGSDRLAEQKVGKDELAFVVTLAAGVSLEGYSNWYKKTHQKIIKKLFEDHSCVGIYWATHTAVSKHYSNYSRPPQNHHIWNV